jgi:hypothetical protein
MGSRRVLLALVAMAVSAPACSEKPAASAPPASAAEMLRPLSAAVPATMGRRVVYVPVYSSIYVGGGSRVRRAELIATVSVRNTSRTDAIVLVSARYYDSAGKELRQYVSRPSQLGPLASVEFVVPGTDTLGGPGANFLIEWAGAPGVDEPVIEAVMLGQAGNAGYSFTSAGRTLKAGVSGP